MRLVFSKLPIIFFAFTYYFPSYGFWDSLIIKNSNHKGSSVLTETINEIFGPLPSSASSSRERNHRIFVEKRGTDGDDDDEQQPIGESGGGLGLLGGGPGGNAAIVCPSGKDLKKGI